jgi:broad specificity phosphatase PhoE
MSRIVLVRHGESVWHAENRYAGSSDIELSDRGREDAQALALWAATAGLQRIYVSDLGRAQRTARAVEAAVGLKATVDPRFRELDFGDGEGLTSSEMRQRFPHRYAAFCNDPVKNHLPGGEDPAAAIARGRAGLQDAASEAGPEGRVLVIAHSTLIRLLLCDLLGIAPSRYRQVFPELGNVSINEILLKARSAALLHFNVPITDGRRANLAG